MKNAIEAIRAKKLGWKKAVKIYQVPKTTLMRLSKEKCGDPAKAVTTRTGRITVLPPELKENVVKYCLVTKSRFFGLTRRDIRRMVLQLSERNGIQYAFGKNRMAGKAWL